MKRKLSIVVAVAMLLAMLPVGAVARTEREPRMRQVAQALSSEEVLFDIFDVPTGAWSAYDVTITNTGGVYTFFNAPDGGHMAAQLWHWDLGWFSNDAYLYFDVEVVAERADILLYDEDDSALWLNYLIADGLDNPWESLSSGRYIGRVSIDDIISHNNTYLGFPHDDFFFGGMAVQASGGHIRIHEFSIIGGGSCIVEHPVFRYDNNPNSWAREYLEDAYDIGLISERVLQGSVWREGMPRIYIADMAARFIEEVSGMSIGEFVASRDPNTLHDIPFTDSNDSDVIALARLGVILGEESVNWDGLRFNPNGLIDRQSAAVLLARLITLFGGEVPTNAPQTDLPFQDAIPSWARGSVYFLYHQSPRIMSNTSSIPGQYLFAPQMIFQCQMMVIAMVRVLGVVAANDNKDISCVCGGWYICCFCDKCVVCIRCQCVRHADGAVCRRAAVVG
ncbi:MAG: hypothetical protein FWE06_06760 [Oscillospiraceae bacterium]|nr:hypothetical protein [Oscillospiraceae bacterium]